MFRVISIFPRSVIAEIDMVSRSYYLLLAATEDQQLKKNKKNIDQSRDEFHFDGSLPLAAGDHPAIIAALMTVFTAFHQRGVQNETDKR